MKLAIIGSRTITSVNLADHLPADVTEIVSGGASGIDTLAAVYAREHDIPLTEFLPDYPRYGRGAPLKRNAQIADYADGALVFWDGSSRGTMHTVELFQKRGKPVILIRTEPPQAPQVPEAPQAPRAD